VKPVKPESTEAASGSAAALDIVVAEDDDATRIGICKAVKMLGHTCRAAAAGDEAWALIEDRRPDVVISDFEMPGMNGAELCRRTRSTKDDAPYVYFILMTGHHDRGRLLEGMAAGADDYQHKPIDVDELEARLMSAARVVGLHRRAAHQAEELRRDSRRFYAASRTDALTGIGNRLRLHEELEAARARIERYGHRYTIAMCDLDHFKALNDGFGHVAGDDALRQVAKAIGGELRAGDGLFRYGGEELVVLLPEQSLEDGALAMERVRRAVERLAIPMPEPGRVLTVSVGVSELDTRIDATVEDSLARVDAALYCAKRHGRNRVEIFRPTSVADAHAPS
jgi:two-component system chemotaxis response regulator CheY